MYRLGGFYILITITQLKLWNISSIPELAAGPAHQYPLEVTPLPHPHGPELTTIQSRSRFSPCLQVSRPSLFSPPPLYPGLQTQLLVEVTGLGSRGGPGGPLPHFSHVVLRGVPQGAELGQVPLEPRGPPERGLLAASLPPTLLSTSGPFSLELVGQDGVGRGLHRAAPQPCAVVPVLLEVRGCGRCGWGWRERGLLLP